MVPSGNVTLVPMNGRGEDNICLSSSFQQLLVAALSPFAITICGEVYILLHVELE